jgi:16S rRNA (guanine966-N2)-methyltransferase
VRIIAGVARGRRLRPPVGDGVRPTGDRVKEAWFSSLAPRLRGATVLDLYSGSGALGLEAASRGAGAVVLVERDRAALGVIEENVATTGLDVTVLAADVARAVGAGGGGAHPVVEAVAPVDVVVADPPYRIPPEELGPVLAALPPLLADGAQVWVETHRDTVVPWPPALAEVRARRYGDTVLHVAQPRVDDPGAAEPVDG